MAGGVAIRDSQRASFVNAVSGNKVVLVDSSGSFIDSSTPLAISDLSAGMFSNHGSLPCVTLPFVVVSGNSSRIGLNISVSGADLFIGSGSTVSVSTGYPIFDLESINFPVNSAVYGVCSAAIGSVYFIEVSRRVWL